MWRCGSFFSLRILKHYCKISCGCVWFDSSECFHSISQIHNTMQEKIFSCITLVMIYFSKETKISCFSRLSRIYNRICFCRACKFSFIATNLSGVFRTLSNISDWVFCENSFTMNIASSFYIKKANENISILSLPSGWKLR